MSDVDLGKYQLRAEHEGFKTTVQEGLVLTVAGAPTLDLTVHPQCAQ
jgi:hypothetical protein